LANSLIFKSGLVLIFSQAASNDSLERGGFAVVAEVMMGCAGQGDYAEAKRTESKPVVKQCF